MIEDKRLLDKIEKELKTEFIPELYDKTMEKMFDQKYYEEQDEGAKQAVKSKQIDIKLAHDEDISSEIEE